MAWITIAELRNSCKSVLGNDPDVVIPTHWDDLVTRGVTAGFNKVRRTLVGRGYTTVQLEGWDDKETWNLLGGLIWVFLIARLDSERISRALELLLEEWKELLSLVLIDTGGDVIDPEGSSNVGYGSYLDDGDDTTIERDTVL